MSNLVHELLLGLLLLPFSTMATAQVIHWELSSHDIPEYFDLEKGYTLSGGFDFNTGNDAISNITVNATAPTIACLLCSNFADGGTGEYFDHRFNDELFPPSILFHSADKTGDVVQSESWLSIFETLVLGENDKPRFDFKTPGSFSNLSLDIEGWLRLDDPYDPDEDEHIGCDLCATAVGTLVPVPEPETYALMLVGLLGVGWKVRSGRKDEFEMKAA